MKTATNNLRQSWHACIHILIVSSLCLIAGRALALGPVSYGFDALTNGGLVGQDGWYGDSAQLPVTSTAAATGIGFNTTKIITSGTTTHDRAIRNFGTPFYSGTETRALLQFDYRVGSDWTSGQFALGGTDNANSVINGDATEVFGPKISLTRNDAGTGIKFSLIPKSGAGWGTAVSNSIVFSPGVISIGNWLQIQLVMNFTTGTGTLFYKNLTLAHSAFTPLFWNANLGLNGAGSSPNQWNQAWMRIDRPGGTPQLAAFDNLTLAANGPGSEDFQGELRTRLFNVWNYTTNLNGETQSMSFPSFVALLANQSAQTLQFNNAYVPNSDNTALFAKIMNDPVQGATNQCVRLHNFAKPGATGGRNELHYSTPYVIENQPNGTQYTFALRFYTPVVFPGNVILLQGYSEFPWLRIHADAAERLMLDLAKSSGTISQNLGPDLDGNNSGDGENPWIGGYKVGSWNAIVVQVIHSNDPTVGRIEVFINGNKMTTYNWRTTYHTDSSKIPFLKAGPYGVETDIWYDDVSWRPGLMNPFLESGLEDNGIYKMEPLCALGKRAEVNGGGDPDNVQLGSGNGSSRQLWTARLQADGCFELVPNFDTDKRLEVDTDAGSNANVRILGDSNQSNQRWRSEWQTDGSFELIPQHDPALRLEVSSGVAANGTNVQASPVDHSDRQRWKLLASLAPPAAPMGLGAGTPAATEIPLTWDLSLFAAGYFIERRSEDGGFKQIANIPFGATVSYTDGDVAPDTAYQYRIFAYNMTGASASSAVLGTATAPDGGQALRPGFLTVTPGAGADLNLEWDYNSGNETGFQIERRAANAAWTLLQTIPEDTDSFTDSSALAGVIYEYRIRTTTDAGNSTWAVSVSLSHASVASIGGGVSSYDGVAYSLAEAPPGSAYVPAGFIYHTLPVGFVSGQTLANLRNDIGGWVGTKITVGSDPLTIYELGRWVVSGNSASHVLKLVDASTGIDIPGGFTSVATAGMPAGQFSYAPLTSPVTIAAHTAYYLLSQETHGGDQWHNWSTKLTYPTHQSRITINSAVYRYGSSPYASMDNVSGSFGPLDFRYSVAMPIITGHGMSTLRNDFSGWLGMEMTTGGSSITVGELGRWVVPGNSGTHSVRLVEAATGNNLGTANVVTAGASSGQFKYAPLSPAVTLAPNTSYYVLSQESAGGDQWHDFNMAAAGSATEYQYWLLANGLPMDESGIGSATATPASDGLPNLVKYALGLSPCVSGNGGRLSYGTASDASNNYLSFTYTRPEPAPSGISYSVEAGSDLSAGGWSASGLVETSSTANSGLRTITIRDSSPMSGGGTRFMHLKITQP